jgi:hypothetical protein
MKKLMCAALVLGLFLLGYGPILAARASVAQKPLNAVVEPIFTVHRGGCQVLQDQLAQLEYELEVSRNFLTGDFGNRSEAPPANCPASGKTDRLLQSRNPDRLMKPNVSTTDNEGQVC